MTGVRLRLVTLALGLFAFPTDSRAKTRGRTSISKSFTSRIVSTCDACNKFP